MTGIGSRPGQDQSRHRCRTPVLGEITAVPPRTATAMLATLALALALAVALRVSGAVTGDLPVLPELPEVAVVVPGVIRASQPTEPDFVRLRDEYGVTAVVDVGGDDNSILSTTEEKAVVESLGMRHLGLDIDEQGLPPGEQVAALDDLLESTVAAPGERRLVLLHDETGRGPVLVASAVVELLSGSPLASALQHAEDHGIRLSPGQSASLQQRVAFADGPGH